MRRPYAYANGNACAESRDSQPNGYPHANLDAYACPHRHADPDQRSRAYCNPHADSNPHAYCNSYANAYPRDD